MDTGNILITNLGNRNLKYCGGFIDKKGEGFFEFTQMLRSEIDTEVDNLSINILDSLLNEYPIQKIYLIVTNQWFHQDTYYEGLIIQYLLKDKYDVEIIEKKDDPRNREKAFLFIEDFFQKHRGFDWENLIVCGSGGIPAMKEALNFYAIVKNPNAMIIDVDENTGAIFHSQIQKEYLKNIEREKIRAMISRYNYAGAKAFLETSYLRDKDLLKKITYCADRFEFLFTDSPDPKLPPNPVTNEEYIWELLCNIQVSYWRADHSFSIAKLYTLYEVLVDEVFTTLLPCDPQDREKIEALNIVVKCTDQGKKYVKIKDKQKYIEKESDRGKINTKDNNLNEVLSSLGKLKHIRNASFIAHELKWIAKSESKELYKKALELLRIYQKDEKGLKRKNIFDLINEELLKEI